MKLKMELEMEMKLEMEIKLEMEMMLEMERQKEMKLEMEMEEQMELEMLYELELDILNEQEQKILYKLEEEEEEEMERTIIDDRDAEFVSRLLQPTTTNKKNKLCGMFRKNFKMRNTSLDRLYALYVRECGAISKYICAQRSTEPSVLKQRALLQSILCEIFSKRERKRQNCVRFSQKYFLSGRAWSFRSCCSTARTLSAGRKQCSCPLFSDRLTRQQRLSFSIG